MKVGGCSWRDGRNFATLSLYAALLGGTVVAVPWKAPLALLGLTQGPAPPSGRPRQRWLTVVLWGLLVPSPMLPSLFQYASSRKATSAAPRVQGSTKSIAFTVRGKDNLQTAACGSLAEMGKMGFLFPPQHVHCRLLTFPFALKNNVLCCPRLQWVHENVDRRSRLETVAASMPGTGGLQGLSHRALSTRIPQGSFSSSGRLSTIGHPFTCLTGMQSLTGSPG